MAAAGSFQSAQDRLRRYAAVGEPRFERPVCEL
jgi:hypothetical protein